MKTMTVRLIVMTLAMAVCMEPVAWATESGNSDSSPPRDIGLGVASIVCSIPYGTAKVVVGTVGGVMGGLTYFLLGFDKEAADAVWYRTMSGDYVVTPDHLRGKKPFRFIGVPPERAEDGHRDNS